MGVTDLCLFCAYSRAVNDTELITIFVRQSADCKYHGDEFCKQCNCRKHPRWTQNGVQHRRKAGTRSWGEADEDSCSGSKFSSALRRFPLWSALNTLQNWFNLCGCP